MPLPIDLGSFTRRRVWQWLVPMLLVLLFLFTLLWLPRQAQEMEANERQEQLIADTLWVEQTIRFQLEHNEDSIRSMAHEVANGYLAGQRLQERMAVLVRNNGELLRLFRLDEHGRTTASSDGSRIDVQDLAPSSRQAFEHARATGTAQYSQPAAPEGGLQSPALMDYHVPLYRGERYLGSLVATYSVASILEQMIPWWFAQDNEIVLTDRDDKVLGRRAAGGAGRGVYTHSRELHLPYATVTLHTNSVKKKPKLLPNLLVGSVVALSLGLIWSLGALWKDINRRIAAEGALREQVAFRAAMENSLVTGMRARDLDGRITYVNPAFCRMVGMRPDELIGMLPPMPYWAPEAVEEYQQHFANVLAGTVSPQGFETIFQRADGERFPVLIFESPLVDDSGRQTGWMGSIMDISDRKRFEELNRRQQEKLQASARLATMGEMASTLAHELNQPLSAISSYTAGACNLLDSDAARTGELDTALLRHALDKAHTQAQRAGQIIRSVHTFVKRREPRREEAHLARLIEDIIPLVELQASQHFVLIQTEIEQELQPVLADALMLEQVLLNLTRNAIESMQEVAPARRLLRLRATMGDSKHLLVEVIDQGHGVPPEVAARLFSPFFSTKAEGMGMGLNICRTAIEFHGGVLSYNENPSGGTIFRFTLPTLDSATNTAFETVAELRLSEKPAALAPVAQGD